MNAPAMVSVSTVLAAAGAAAAFIVLLRLWERRGRPLPFLHPRNRLWTAFLRFVGPRLIAYSRKHPYFDLEGCMERHWIVKPSRRSASRSARIHKILRSDSGRCFHDHPWPYVSVILEGGYTEVTPIYSPSGIYQGSQSTYYGPGSVLIRPAKHMHRLVLPEGQTATTLFLCGCWEQEWGFFRSPEWKTHWKDYLADEASARPRHSAPVRREFLVCVCSSCGKLSYAHRYDSPEDRERAKPDFLALVRDGRSPAVVQIEVGPNGRAVLPDNWCECDGRPATEG